MERLEIKHNIATLNMYALTAFGNDDRCPLSEYSIAKYMKEHSFSTYDSLLRKMDELECKVICQEDQEIEDKESTTFDYVRTYVGRISLGVLTGLCGAYALGSVGEKKPISYNWALRLGLIAFVGIAQIRHSPEYYSREKNLGVGYLDQRRLERLKNKIQILTESLKMLKESSLESGNAYKQQEIALKFFQNVKSTNFTTNLIS